MQESSKLFRIIDHQCVELFPTQLILEAVHPRIVVFSFVSHLQKCSPSLMSFPPSLAGTWLVLTNLRSLQTSLHSDNIYPKLHLNLLMIQFFLYSQKFLFLSKIDRKNDVRAWKLCLNSNEMITLFDSYQAPKLESLPAPNKTII